MMNDFDRKQKGLAALNERVQGFLQDGYNILINYKDDRICLVKLKHHNGNSIVVKIDLESGILSQLTNNVRNYHQKVC